MCNNQMILLPISVPTKLNLNENFILVLENNGSEVEDNAQLEYYRSNLKSGETLVLIALSSNQLFEQPILDLSNLDVCEYDFGITI